MLWEAGEATLETTEVKRSKAPETQRMGAGEEDWQQGAASLTASRRDAHLEQQGRHTGHRSKIEGDIL